MPAWSWIGAQSHLLRRRIRASATCRRCLDRSVICRIQVGRQAPKTSTPPQARWHWSESPGYNGVWLRASRMRMQTCATDMSMRRAAHRWQRATADCAAHLIALRACAHRSKRCTMRACPGMCRHHCCHARSPLAARPPVAIRRRAAAALSAPSPTTASQPRQRPTTSPSGTS